MLSMCGEYLKQCGSGTGLIVGTVRDHTDRLAKYGMVRSNLGTSAFITNGRYVMISPAGQGTLTCIVGYWRTQLDFVVYAGDTVVRDFTIGMCNLNILTHYDKVALRNMRPVSQKLWCYKREWGRYRRRNYWWSKK